ncbi:MAG: hypothetical protein HYY28_13790 [Betaproteobacteria bacterium]|nr:hypothetical protein [Betaproteobacteria bacterium]MBI2961380.1 hypothetical protein [Betaproteobacteria bacterium]
MRISPIALVLFGALSLPAFAQAPAKDPTATPGIDKRRATQQQRIDQGVASGQITEREAARLQKGQARVERMKERAKADGKVTKQERARIHQAQNVESRKIAREKRDRQQRR